MYSKPYEFVGFGAMYGTKPYEFVGFGAMDATRPYEFIGFGVIKTQVCAVPGLRKLSRLVLWTVLPFYICASRRL